MDNIDKEAARKELGARVRLLREEQNIGLRKFALMVGMSKDYLVDVEYGRKSPSLDTIMKIAGGLGMTASELLDGVGGPAREQGEVRYRTTQI